MLPQIITVGVSRVWKMLKGFMENVQHGSLMSWAVVIYSYMPCTSACCTETPQHCTPIHWSWNIRACGVQSTSGSEKQWNVNLSRNINSVSFQWWRQGLKWTELERIRMTPFSETFSKKWTELRKCVSYQYMV